MAFTCRYKWLRCAKQSEYGKHKASCFMQSDSDCNVISSPTINSCHLALNLKGWSFNWWGLLTILGQIPLKSDITSTQTGIKEEMKNRKSFRLKTRGDELGKWSRACRQYNQIHLWFHFLKHKNYIFPALLSRVRFCW